MLTRSTNIQATLAAVLTTVGMAASAPAASPATPAPDYDFQWATITHAGNAPYLGPNAVPPIPGFPDPGPAYTYGRGSVPYEYRIAKSEITSGQWAEFINAFSARPDYQQFETLFGRNGFIVDRPIFAAHPDSDYRGPGRYYSTIADGVDYANWPVFGISWRDAAMYCNWLHNGKDASMASLLEGAYDTNTWSLGPPPYTDALTHEPGARFWIPTLDEWIKAVYYDPDKNGPDQGGWWAYVHGSETPPVSGYPDEPGSTTSGLLSGGVGTDLDPLAIPLGAYVDHGAVSPWGLVDTASGAGEWIEEPFFGDPSSPYLTNRGYMGVYAGSSLWLEVGAHVSTVQGAGPTSGFVLSVRLASSVPAPSIATPLLTVSGVVLSCRRRRILPCSTIGDRAVCSWPCSHSRV